MLYILPQNFFYNPLRDCMRSAHVSTPFALCQVLKDATSGSKAELAEVMDTFLLSMKAWTFKPRAGAPEALAAMADTQCD